MVEVNYVDVKSATLAIVLLSRANHKLELKFEFSDKMVLCPQTGEQEGNFNYHITETNWKSGNLVNLLSRKLHYPAREICKRIRKMILFVTQ